MIYLELYWLVSILTMHHIKKIQVPIILATRGYAW